MGTREIWSGAALAGSNPALSANGNHSLDRRLLCVLSMPSGGQHGCQMQPHEAVRRFATGVSVLTVGHGGDAHGITVSAMMVVSKDPLIVAACVRTGSRFTAAVEKTRRFAANLLDSRQAALARWFADPDRPDGRAQFGRSECESDPFSGAPWIVGSLASMGCKLEAITPVGDHDVLLAEVVTATAGAGSPLLNYGGGLYDAILRKTEPRGDAFPGLDAALGINLGTRQHFLSQKAYEEEVSR